jgi:hypothetical protein
LIGADIALWPSDDTISLKTLVLLGLVIGASVGVFIAWVVGQLEDLR